MALVANASAEFYSTPHPIDLQFQHVRSNFLREFNALFDDVQKHIIKPEQERSELEKLQELRAMNRGLLLQRKELQAEVEGLKDNLEELQRQTEDLKRSMAQQRQDRRAAALQFNLERAVQVRHALAAEAFQRLGRAPIGGRSPTESSVPSTPYKDWLAMRGQAVDLKLVAQLLAKVHSRPPQWFEGWAKVSRYLWPWMSNVDAQSHVWVHTCHPEDFDNIEEQDLKDWANSKLSHPVSDIARKLVTSHGNFHMPNIYMDEDGQLKCANLSRACVTFAVEDLSSFVSRSCGELEARREFLYQYLLALGRSTSSEAVDALLLDCRIYRLSLKWLSKDARLADMKEVVTTVRREKGPLADVLRQTIIEEWLTAAASKYRELAAVVVPGLAGRTRSLSPMRSVWEHASPVRERAQSLERADHLLQAAVAEPLLALPAPEELAAAGDPGLDGHHGQMPWLNEVILSGEYEGQNVKVLLEEQTYELGLDWPSLLRELSRHPDVAKKAEWSELLEKAAKTTPVHETRDMISGRLWLVIGGAKGAGIVVRRGPETRSEVYRFRLSTGAVVQEVERRGDRLKFERVRGDGPDIGWASIQAGNTELLLALPGLPLPLGGLSREWIGFARGD